MTSLVATAVAIACGLQLRCVQDLATMVHRLGLTLTLLSALCMSSVAGLFHLLYKTSQGRTTAITIRNPRQTASRVGP
eukprot:5580338-Amphidinium_carterae.1